MESKQKSTLSKLLKFAGKYRFFIILAIVFSGMSAILSLFPFVCIWFVVKDIFKALPDVTQATQSIKYGWMAVGFSLLSITLYFISLMCSHLAAFRVEKNMRKEAMHKIVTLPLGFFTKNTSGKLRKVIDDNASLTHGFLAHQLPDLSGVIIMPIAIVIILFIFDWSLGLVCLAPIFLSLLILRKMMGGNNAKFMKKYMDALEDMNASAVEYVRGIPVVKVFQQTVYSFKNFHKSIKGYSDFASEYAINCRVPMIGFTITINAPALLLIPIGILFILNGSDYNAFLLDLIFYMLFSPLIAVMMTKILFSSENIMAAKEALIRIDEILEAKSLEETNQKKQTNENDIVFKNVSFTYPESGKAAICNVSFTIPKGKTFALVGPSGGGKSTLASLVARFWDVDCGRIEIGGVNVKDFEEKDLMEKIAFVFQNSKLFKTSLLENIRLANPKATRKEVMKAAHLAQCDDIIEKMPQGIDTVVGTEGVYLSGGEQQRIALARAILKDSPIIILDEATAFADPENEYQIQKAFESLVQDKTVLMIAHRLSSIKDVDSILVIKDGKIVESGDHENLSHKNGTYKKMWEEYQTSISWKVGKVEANV
ncbi:MAG: ABC transporter ATP-binding protein/permease [Anaeromicrobium sp.]|jgi:ATP-binding cassette subfamily B protein|uniref:ABC transporter ATP-binding protein n=1 Tax=Anaeromicrobium sp. TaxID=1929132 RepID=UPI0025F6E6C6|nr:ABC transporter ATP-binding protein [Anaeromicrobium sp.]MCT4596143.1 ABC transporter ATP-binding protein/permease [Anaeromicrobium sp.]